MSWNCEIFSTFVWFYGTRRVATVPPASEVSSVGHGAGWRYLYRRRACHTHGTFRTYAFQNLWGADGINIIIYGRYSRHDFYALCFTPARNAESVTKMELCYGQLEACWSTQLRTCSNWLSIAGTNMVPGGQWPPSTPSVRLQPSN